jgi:hypothetical protein
VRSSSRTFQTAASLVSGKGQRSDWTVPIVNGDSESKSDLKLRSFIE